MAVSKVIYDGNTLIDISTDTVTAETLVEGVTAHNAKGEQITGTMTAGGSVEDDVLYIDTSEMTDFRYFCCYNRFIDKLDVIDTSNGTNFMHMFNSCTALTTITQLDTSKGTNFGSMFQGCTALTTITHLDISKGTNFGTMFYNCTSLETVSLTVSKINFATSTFQNCTTLQNITIGEGWAVSIYLHYSEQLTKASLHGMIENLADLTGKATRTFQVGTTNIAKIDADHIAMLSAKNWSYS